MNKYYLDIIEQMGFSIPDKKQKVVEIYPMDSSEVKVAGIIDMDKSHFNYDDAKKGKYILIEEGYKSYFTTNPGEFYVTAAEKEDELLGLTIHSEKSYNTLHIGIVEKTVAENSLVAEVNVDVSFYFDKPITEKFYFRVFSDKGEISVVKYSGNRASKKVDLEECTSKNVINTIIAYLATSEISDDLEIRKGFKMVLPAVISSVNDMLDYCKENTIHYSK